VEKTAVPDAVVQLAERFDRERNAPTFGKPRNGEASPDFPKEER